MRIERSHFRADPAKSRWIDVLRVPNIIVSPFAKPGYVGHTPMDHTAVLRFVEKRFNVPPLTARDAAQPDLMEFFDFVNVPMKTPPTPPVPVMNDAACTPDRMR